MKRALQLGAIATLATLVTFGACHRGATDGPAAVGHVAAVKRGTLVDRVILTGELRPSPAGSVRIVAPMVDGDLTIRYLADDGMLVHKGDRLVGFDTSEFTKGLEDTRTAAHDAELTASDAEAVAALSEEDSALGVRQAEITLEKAKLKAGIPADLQSPHDAQKNDLDEKEAEIALVKAKRDLESLHKANELEHHVRDLTRDKARRALDDAEKVISQLEIISPVDGVFVVADHFWQPRKFQLSDQVYQGMVLARLPDADHALEVDGDLSDVDDGRVSVGMTGQCVLDAYPDDPIPCTLDSLTPVATDKNKTSLRRVFATVLSLGKSDHTRQRPGMSVKIVLARAPLADQLIAPRGAIVFDEDGKTTRARLSSGELREVTLGPCDAQACAIAKGLTDGEQVLE